MMARVMRDTVLLVVGAAVLFAVCRTLPANLAYLEFLRSRFDSAADDREAEARLLTRLEAIGHVDARARYLSARARRRSAEGLEMCPGEAHEWLFLLTLNEARDVLAAGDRTTALSWHAWLASQCPPVFDAMVDWAVALRADGSLVAAAARLESALSLEPLFQPANTADEPPTVWARAALVNAHGELANVYLQLGRRGAAIEHLETARRLQGTRVSASLLQLLGIAYYHEGRLTEARTSLEAALHSDPSLADARTYLSWISRQP